MAQTYEGISSTTLESATSAITLSSIPSGFTDLKLVMVGKNTTAGTNARITFNSVGTGQYYYTYLGQSNNTVSTAVSNSANYFSIPALTSPSASNPFMIELNIQQYISNFIKKPILAKVATNNNTTGGYSSLEIGYGYCNTTSTITSITITNSSSTWATGTSVALYGIETA